MHPDDALIPLVMTLARAGNATPEELAVLLRAMTTYIILRATLDPEVLTAAETQADAIATRAVAPLL